MQHSENTLCVSDLQACLPQSGDWRNALGKSPRTEPAALSPKSIRVVDFSGPAHARTNPGTAIEIMWANDVSWSKDLQFHQIKPPTSTELHPMEHSNILERIAPSDGVPIASAEGEHVLNVTMVYQDRTAREWATEMWGRVTQLVGKENISAASWSISDLARPGILVEAVRSAVRADVIVVAVSDAKELPPDLCAWIDVWLPRRVRGTGALVALIGLPEEPDHQAFSTQDYLRAVADNGGLDFFPQERVQPVASAGFFDMKKIAEEADAMTPVLAGIVGGEENMCRHWGINE